jgi:hypothetical protein
MLIPTLKKPNTQQPIQLPTALLTHIHRATLIRILMMTATIAHALMTLILVIAAMTIITATTTLTTLTHTLLPLMLETRQLMRFLRMLLDTGPSNGTPTMMMMTTHIHITATLITITTQTTLTPLTTHTTLTIATLIIITTLTPLTPTIIMMTTTALVKMMKLLGVCGLSFNISSPGYLPFSEQWSDQKI